MDEKRPPLWRRTLRGLLRAVLALLLAALFYLAIVVGQPQTDVAREVDWAQPLLAPSPEQQLSEAAELPQLIDSFPAPVLWAPGGGLSLVAADSRDFSMPGGVGRILTLIYRSQSDLELQAQSIYPARAAERLEDSRFTLRGEGSSLGGLRTVMLSNAESICYIAQGTQALYRVTLPQTDEATVMAALQPLQLSEE